MKDKTIYAVFDSYINGNISWVKSKIKLMSKAEFITFLEYARNRGYNLDRLKHLVGRIK